MGFILHPSVLLFKISKGWGRDLDWNGLVYLFASHCLLDGGEDGWNMNNYPRSVFSSWVPKTSDFFLLSQIKWSSHVGDLFIRTLQGRGVPGQCLDFGPLPIPPSARASLRTEGGLCCFYTRQWVNKIYTFAKVEMQCLPLNFFLFFFIRKR